MRNFINTNKELLNRVITIENKLDKKITDYDAKFEKIFDELQSKVLIICWKYDNIHALIIKYIYGKS